MPENFRRAKAHSREDLERVPPVPEQSLDLTGLTEQEAKIIQAVLQKDEAEKTLLDAKISEVRKEIHEIRKAGALTAGDDQNAICARCKFKFGLLPWGERGQRCATCKFRVCNKCRSKERNGAWLCILCLKYRQEKLLTGEWTSSGQNEGLQGSDLVRASLRYRRQVQSGYEEADGVNYTQRPAKNRDADSESRTSKNSQSSTEQQPGILLEKSGHTRAPSPTSSTLQTFRGRVSPKPSRSLAMGYSRTQAESQSMSRVGGEISAAKDSALAVSATPPPIRRVFGASYLADTDCSDDATSLLSVDIGDGSVACGDRGSDVTNTGVGDHGDRVTNKPVREESFEDPPLHLSTCLFSSSHPSDPSLSSGHGDNNSSLYSSNSVSDQTLYYDDVKLGNPNLSRLSTPESRSSSSLCSDYGNNPKYMSLKPATGRSELELFRKRGERYSMKRKKAQLEKEKQTENDVRPKTPPGISRRISVHTNNEWIPHWHETLRRQSVVEMVTKHIKTGAVSPSPILNVTPPIEDQIFTLVKPRRSRPPMRAKNPNYLSPDHSRDNSSSSQESISAYVEAAKASVSEASCAETNLSSTGQASLLEDADTAHISAPDTNSIPLVTSTPKSERGSTSGDDRNSRELPQADQEVSSNLQKTKGNDTSASAPTLSGESQVPVGESKQSVPPKSGKANPNLSRGTSFSLPRQRLRRSGYGASLPKNWHRHQDTRGKRRLPTVGKIAEKKEEKEIGAGEKVKLTSGQRRDSYSRALENQKVTVVLPKGNKTRDRVSSSEDEGWHPKHAPPGVEPLDLGKDRDSDSSSLVSYTDSHNASSISTNQGFSSEDNRSMREHDMHDENTNHDHHIAKTSSPRGMPAALPNKFRFRRSSSSSQSDIPRRDSLETAERPDAPESKRQVDVNTKRSAAGVPQHESAGGSVAADTRRKDSFEDIYNSNVNRLVAMMTGGQAAGAMDSERTGHSKQKRGLPQRPSNGKSKHLLLQQSLSLSEEVAENIKYQSIDDVDDDENKEEQGQEQSSTKDVEEVKVEEEKLLLPSEIKKQQNNSGAKFFSPMKDGTSTEKMLPKSGVPEKKDFDLDNDTGITPSVRAKRSPLMPENDVAKTSVPASSKHQTTSSIGEEPPQKETPLKSILKKSHPPEVKEQLEQIAKARDGNAQSNARTQLCRSESAVSDTLSIITEISEPYGEAESLPYDSDTGSDGTLHDRNFENTFSDEEETTDSLNSSVRLNLNVSKKPENEAKGEREEDDDDNPTTVEPDSDSEITDDAKDSPRSIDSQKDAPKPLLSGKEEAEEDSDRDSPESQSRQDSSPEGYTIEREPSINSQISDLDSEKESRDSECSMASRESTESGRHAELEMESDVKKPILEEPSDTEEDRKDAAKLAKFNNPEDHEKMSDEGDEAMLRSLNDEDPDSSAVETAGLGQLSQKATLLSIVQQKKEEERQLVYSTNSHVPEAHVDLDEDSSAWTRGGARVRGGAYDPEDYELVRDSDSGVNSSQTSRTNTPEQRGQPHRSQTDHLSVPAIAVTNSNDERGEREEDDDIDELFKNHRPHLLGSRSSLADSRESIYSVYSDAGEVNYGRIPVTGEILFNLAYDYKSNVLEVHVKQCKDLAPVDTKHKRSDPYIKTYLLPDKSRGSKRKSKIKKHTLNPTFDEVLKYPISKSELESRTLWLTVWHNDRFGRNDFLGEVTIPLDYYRFDDNAPRWYPLQERAAPQETMMSYKGDLFISIKYVTPDMVEASPKKKSGSFRRKGKEKEKPQANLGEVHVLVREAQNLTAMRGSAGSNPFCKGYLLPDVSHSSKQKTPVVKKTTNPQWQHILVFEGVDQSQLKEHGLELTIWDHEKLSSNDFLGGVRLNLGQGTYQGKPVDWMDARGEEIEAWQSLMEHINEWVDVQLPLRASMGKQNVKK